MNRLVLMHNVESAAQQTLLSNLLALSQSFLNRAWSSCSRTDCVARDLPIVMVHDRSGETRRPGLGKGSFPYQVIFWPKSERKKRNYSGRYFPGTGCLVIAFRNPLGAVIGILLTLPLARLHSVCGSADVLETTQLHPQITVAICAVPYCWMWGSSFDVGVVQSLSEYDELRHRFF